MLFSVSRVYIQRAPVHMLDADILQARGFFKGYKGSQAPTVTFIYLHSLLVLLEVFSHIRAFV